MSLYTGRTTPIDDDRRDLLEREWGTCLDYHVKPVPRSAIVMMWIICMMAVGVMAQRIEALKKVAIEVTGSKLVTVDQTLDPATRRGSARE